MSPARRWISIVFLGLGHGLGDLIAGTLLASLGSHFGTDVVLCYFVYNTVAFLGQPFAGLICDRTGGIFIWFLASLLLSGASLLLFDAWPVFAIVMSGLASAFYHSSGGAFAWKLGGRTTLAAGLFAAPGVIGLAAGLAYGSELMNHQWALILFAQISVVPALWWLLGKTAVQKDHSPKVSLGVSGLLGGLFGWIVLLSIAARSFAWSLGQSRIFPPEDAVRLALAAAAGKFFAGFLSDRFGARRIACLSMGLAALFLLLSARYPFMIFPAVTALQAGTAPMLGLVLEAWPRHPAFASGLAQGLAIAAGGAPLLFLTQFGHLAIITSAVSLLAAAILMLWRITRPKPDLQEFAKG